MVNVGKYTIHGLYGILVAKYSSQIGQTPAAGQKHTLNHRVFHRGLITTILHTGGLLYEVWLHQAALQSQAPGCLFWADDCKCLDRDPPFLGFKISAPQVCFWWLGGSNFRPLEDSGG